MKSRFGVSVLLIFAQATTCFAQASQARQWLTAYYSLWSVPILYPEEIDFSHMTHVVHFSANPTKTYPYLDVLVPAKPGKFNQDSVNIEWGGVYNGNNPPLWRTVNIQKTLIDRAHQSGAKVLLSLGGVHGPGAAAMSFIASDPSRREVFVSSACDYALRKGYDGLELDWEFPRADERGSFAALIRLFRDRLDKWPRRGVLAIAVNHSPFRTLGYDAQAMNEAFDQINLMTYEMFWGDYRNVKTGFNTPLEIPDKYDGYSGYALEQAGIGAKAWISFGVQPHKIGLGISFLTTEFIGVREPVEPGKPFKSRRWGYLRDVPSQGRYWDDKAQAPWCVVGYKMITYEDAASVRKKVEYAKKIPLGGVMIFDLLGGYLPSEKKGKRDALLQAASASVFGGSGVRTP